MIEMNTFTLSTCAQSVSGSSRSKVTISAIAANWDWPVSLGDTDECACCAMAFDATNNMAADKRPSFIEHSYFLITLPNATPIFYDLDHMRSDPFSHLPTTACRIIDMHKGDVLFRQNQTTSGLYRVVSGCVTLQRTGQRRAGCLPRHQSSHRPIIAMRFAPRLEV